MLVHANNPDNLLDNIIRAWHRAVHPESAEPYRPYDRHLNAIQRAIMSGMPFGEFDTAMGKMQR